VHQTELQLQYKVIQLQSEEVDLEEMEDLVLEKMELKVLIHLLVELYPQVVD
jgi:hypothetical protein